MVDVGTRSLPPREGDCRAFAEDVPAYLAGTLDPRRERELRRHLRGCVSGCRTTIANSIATPRLARERSPASPPAARGRVRWVFALAVVLVLSVSLSQLEGDDARLPLPPPGETFRSFAKGWTFYALPDGGSLAIAPNTRLERIPGEEGLALYLHGGEVRWKLVEGVFLCASRCGTLRGRGPGEGAALLLDSGMEVGVTAGEVELGNAHGFEMVGAARRGSMTPFARPVVTETEPPTTSRGETAAGR